MKYHIVIAILFTACHGGAERNTSLRPDTLAGADIQKVIRSGDTAILKKPVIAHDDEETGPTLQEVLDQMKDEYERPLVVDTTIYMRKKILHLYVRHYCLLDSAIRIPKRYIFWGGLDSYVAHTLLTQVKLEEDSRILLDRTIRKEDFKQLLYPHYPDLDTFAVLRRPGVDVKDDVIRLAYSISIPLTDLGVGADALIDEKGSISFKIN